MKKITLAIAGLLLLANGINLFAQQPVQNAQGECTGVEIPLPAVLSGNCANTLSNIPVLYRSQGNYIPDQNTPVKTLKVSLYIIQDANGNGNFQQSNSTHTQFLQDLIAGVNNMYANLQPPSDPITSVCGTCHIVDSRIQFELQNIYYQLGSYQPINPDKELSIVFALTTGSVIGGNSNLASLDNLNTNHIVNMFNVYSSYVAIGPTPWITVPIIVHELAHNLGLLHNYFPTCCPESCDINGIDYLTDVFGPPGSQICWHDYGFNCDPFASGNTCTNNIMGGTKTSDYLTPLQLGRIHRNLSIMSIRKYVKDDTYSLIPLAVSQNETWNFDFRLYQGISLAAAKQLSITCNVWLPINVTSTLNTSSKISIGNSIDPALLHLDPNSFLNIGSGAEIQILPNGRLEIHENCELIINSGGRLVIENGGEITLHRGAKILVKQGGTLEFKNSTAGKGIVFGPQPAASAESFIEIAGNLQVAANTTFTFTGDGYINWKNGNSSIFNSGSKLTLNGSGKTDLLMKLENAAIVNISAPIEIQNGKIEYSSNTSFNVSNGSVLLKNLNLTGVSNTTSTGFNGSTLTSFRIETSDVNNLANGVRLENFTSLARILACTFNNCGTSVYANNLDAMQFASTTVQGGNYGYALENIRVATATGNQISGCDVGVKLSGVQGFYMDGGKIFDILYTAGISGFNSLVFLRNGAVIEGQSAGAGTGYAIGIDIMGKAPTIVSPSYKSMVTVGDQGCGTIINCATAIKGENTLLNIDAVQHAINRKTPNDVRPNRFDGNVQYLDLCYNASIGNLIPSEILAKGNFWRVSSGNQATWHGTMPQANKFSVKKKANGANCSQNISVDYSCWSECLYSQIQTGCMNCSMTAQCQPGNSGNTGNNGGGGGGIIPPGGPPEECPAKIRLSGKTIEQAFKDANELFLQEDKMETRANFKEIADLQLSKDNAGDIIVCDPNALSCGGNGGNPGEKISNPCAQLVHVAKVLHEGTPSTQQRTGNPENEGNSEQEISTSKIQNPYSEIILYPNPNNGNMTLEYNFTEDENGRFIIYDLTGRKISEYTLTSEKNRLALSESKLSTGVFYYQVVVNQTPVKTGKLTVIK